MPLNWVSHHRSSITICFTLCVVLGYFISSACAQEQPNGRQRRNRRNDAAQQAGDVTEGPEISDDEILATIKKQVDYLLSRKKGDNWEPDQKYYGQFFVHGGETCIAMYALLYAGRCIDDPRLNIKSPELKPVADYIRQLTPDYTYAASMQINALALISNVMKDPLYKGPLSQAAQALVDADSPEGSYSYMWKVPEKHMPLFHGGGERPEGDNSNAQYGLLGVWVAQDAGFEVPENYWSAVHNHWTKSQNVDGGWSYTDRQKNSTLNMTAAGLASLYITTECVDLSPPRLVGTPNPALDKGLAWMEEHFEARNDAYGLYGCERVGLASGLKYFGTHNWYQEGAAAIIAKDDNGSSKLRVDGQVDDIPSTAYSLLFLCRGRNPVLFNKLEYHNPTDPKPLIWDARPRDLANLTHWFSKKFEEDFNWHVVNLQIPVEEWMDTPVLLITGSRDPNFTAADIAKLKTFVDNGGMIFSSNDGSTEAFDDAMRRYAGQICDRQYEMRELPKDHPLYSIQYNIADTAHLLGMSNGIRELWVHSTADLGASWQRRAYAHLNDWYIPSNLYLYATGKVNSREKFQNLVVRPANGGTTRTISVARVDYAGNWDPEPGAWPRMAKLAASSFHTTLNVSNVRIFNLDAKETPIAHMTGTAGFTISPDIVDILRQYLDSGGTLIVDAGGGSDTFINSFNKMVAELYPKDTLDDVPGDSPLITGEGITDSGDISSVEYRKSTLKKGGKPPLMGVMHNGRYVILMSPFDFTSGLLGTNTWDIQGYTPDSAQAIVRNLLLFAATPPRPQPAAAKQTAATK